MKITVGTVTGAIVAVLIGMVTDEILQIILTLGIIGILIFSLFYLNEYWQVSAGGLVFIVIWILSLFVDPVLQIELLVGLLIVTAVIESIWVGLMTTIVEGITGGFEALIGFILDR